ncbi:MAG: NAD-dependent epimerase/dehydratase family protein [Pirellulales bacterium]
MSAQQTVKPPAAIENVEQLEDLLSDPTERAIECMARVEGDLILLGVGGKIGPTLARMARRASDAAGMRRRIFGVSRFSSTPAEAQLRQHGIDTIRCDLTDPAQLDRLPDVPNVVFMAGMKFGSTGNESLTWMTNVFLPGMVCRKFCHSRIVAFSTGNVYGLAPVARGGSVESDPLRPVGEYAMSAVGRERILEHFSQAQRIPLALLRLNYAHEMRYGVLVDIARAVGAEQPVDLTMGHFNALWQGDANAMALVAFDHLASPPRVINLAGAELLSVRYVAEEFGRLLNRRVVFCGTEAPDAVLSNGQLGFRLCGDRRIGAQQMMEWTADWVRRGGECLNKPTHFQVRDGIF